MNLAEVGACIAKAVKEEASIECTAIQDGCCWCGVISITSTKGEALVIRTPPIYVSRDIASGGVEFLVASIKKSMVERKPVKSWEAPLQETRDVRLSA